MDNKIHQVGSVAANGKFYTPKYFVGKFKDSDDVLLHTAHKSLDGCRCLVELSHSEQISNIVIVSVEIKNTSDTYFEV